MMYLRKIQAIPAETRQSVAMNVAQLRRKTFDTLTAIDNDPRYHLMRDSLADQLALYATLEELLLECNEP